MKNSIILIAITVLSIASWNCKKENSNNQLNIRYQFTATLAGNYTLETKTGTLNYTETINNSSFTRTVVVTDDRAATDTASFTAFPPLDWYGTSNRADVTLKIFINEVERASVNAVFVGIDRPVGTTIYALY